MLSGGHLQSGPRATQNSTITASSSGAQQPNASSDLPILLYPLDVTSPPPSIYPFTPSSTAEACTLRIPPQSYVYGPFRASRVLAEGGFGRAMVAQDLASQCLLCLKVFRRDRMSRKRDKENLFTELAVYKHIAAWRRPDTIFLMELEMSFQTKDHICFAMDLMAGDLHHFLTYDREYCPENASRWSAQMALGINALHGVGIIHRDIKAENILIECQDSRLRSELRVTTRIIYSRPTSVMVDVSIFYLRDSFSESTSSRFVNVSVVGVQIERLSLSGLPTSRYGPSS